MAQAVLFNIAQGILTSLSSSALQELGLCWGVQDELEKLASTFSTIKSVLLDAEKQPSDSAQLEDWLHKLKESVYDADDLLDDFMTEALRRQVMSGNAFTKEVRCFFSSSNQLVYGIKMAHKMKAVRERLALIVLDRNSFHFEQCPEECTHALADRAREHTHSSTPTGAIGRENDMKNAVDSLRRPFCGENVVVYAIYGIGGTGKTTLAQLVYNNPTITSHFEVKIWICVPRNFDVKEIVVKILESSRMKEKNSETQNMETLKDLLHKKINKKKYLLVLDDVWNNSPQLWSTLMDLLMVGSEGSRILVTTRELSIANLVTTRPCTPYHLDSLSYSDSWTLFSQIAFKGRELRPPNRTILAIAKKIVHRCAGVPLAIKTMARLMSSKETESEWTSFEDRELLNLKENDVLSSLQLSYNHLPSHLKHCFTFCSLFPKGYIIRVKMLINLWISLGYIPLADLDRCPEDIGLDYFMELKWRSLFEDVSENIWGSVSACRMHDLMHDLATSVSEAEISSSDSAGLGNVNKEMRHMSLSVDFTSPWQVPSSLLQANKLRTFFFLGKSTCQMEVRQCNELFSNLRSLRVLNLNDMGIEIVPHSIGKLKHLRYLDLSGNKSIEKLPDSITNLQNLLVLKLRKCKMLKQLPKDMRKLINLRHLNTNKCESLKHMPRGIGKLTSLRKLSMFVVADCTSDSKHCGGLDELCELNNLRRELIITNLQYVKPTSTNSGSSAANLKEKKHLERLTLHWTRECMSADDKCGQDLTFEGLEPHKNLKGLIAQGFGGTKFPSWFSQLEKIVTIEIKNCNNCQRLPRMDTLPCLKVLKLNGLTDLEYIETGPIIDGCAFFDSLEELSLSNCPKLKGWMKAREITATSVTTEADLRPEFSKLSSLMINGCPNLVSMPAAETLQILRLEAVRKITVEQILKVVTPRSALSLLQIEDLEFLSGELFEEMSHLVQLWVYNCPRLKGLSEVLQHLPKLMNLSIEECEELSFIDDDSRYWQGLKNLQTLIIDSLPNLKAIPEGLQQVPTLCLLRIAQCPNLESLPEWISKLGSIQHLIIEGCEHLHDKCKSNKGEDWLKIKHIPNIKIDDKVIRSTGYYYD